MTKEIKKEYHDLILLIKKAEDLGLDEAVMCYKMKLEGFELACRIMNIDLENK